MQEFFSLFFSQGLCRTPLHFLRNRGGAAPPKPFQDAAERGSMPIEGYTSPQKNAFFLVGVLPGLRPGLVLVFGLWKMLELCKNFEHFVRNEIFCFSLLEVKFLILDFCFCILDGSFLKSHYNLLKTRLWYSAGVNSSKSHWHFKIH